MAPSYARGLTKAHAGIQMVIVREEHTNVECAPGMIAIEFAASPITEHATTPPAEGAQRMQCQQHLIGKINQR